MTFDTRRFQRTRDKIGKEAARAQRRLGAVSCAMICFFEDGKNPLVLIDGGTSPIPPADLYANLARVYIEKGAPRASEPVLAAEEPKPSCRAQPSSPPPPPSSVPGE